MNNFTEKLDFSNCEYEDIRSSIRIIEKNQRSLNRQILWKIDKTMEYVKICNYVFNHKLVTRYSNSLEKWNTMNADLRIITEKFERNLKILDALNMELGTRWF